MNSHSHYNYGKALFPKGVTIFFPTGWPWEKCRKVLRDRGIKLTSGRWDGIYATPVKTLIDFIYTPIQPIWIAKHDISSTEFTSTVVFDKRLMITTGTTA